MILQEDFSIYAHLLLNTRREKEKNKFPCNRNDACCGICDNFYPCLFDLLKELNLHAKKQLENRLKEEGLK